MQQKKTVLTVLMVLMVLMVCINGIDSMYDVKLNLPIAYMDRINWTDTIDGIVNMCQENIIDHIAATKPIDGMYQVIDRQDRMNHMKNGTNND